jgi:hypothetical protein
MSLELEGGQKSRRVVGPSRAFLLRRWQEAEGSAGDAPTWRFSLTHIDSTREKKGFADLEGVLAYLQQILKIEDRTTSEGEPS